MRQYMLIALALMVATGLQVVGADDPAGKVNAVQPVPGFRPSLSKGGSNYMFYALRSCNRSDYVVAAYRDNQAIIDGQLLRIFTDGQRRLRISVPLTARRTAGSEASSTPAFHPESVEALLKRIKFDGFEEVLVVVGDSTPSVVSWQSWDEDEYQRRWTAIRDVRTLLTRSGLPYRLDLLNEGIPAINQPMLLRYTNRLWRDYRQSFGTSDTVGFSVIADPQGSRLAQMSKVYDGVLPGAFDLHIYDDASQSFRETNRRLAGLGLGEVPWIVGEAFYNDAVEAQQLGQAALELHRQVLFLLQWPLSRERHCRDVDVSYPLSFDQYGEAGF